VMRQVECRPKPNQQSWGMRARRTVCAASSIAAHFLGTSGAAAISVISAIQSNMRGRTCPAQQRGLLSRRTGGVFTHADGTHRPRTWASSRPRS